MKDQIVLIISEYLSKDSMDRFKKIYANRLSSHVTQCDIDRFQSPPNAWPDDCVAIKSRREQIDFQNNETADLIREIASEISEKIEEAAEMKLAAVRANAQMEVAKAQLNATRALLDILIKNEQDLQESQ